MSKVTTLKRIVFAWIYTSEYVNYWKILHNFVGNLIINIFFKSSNDNRLRLEILEITL